MPWTALQCVIVIFPDFFFHENSLGVLGKKVNMSLQAEWMPEITENEISYAVG